MVSRFFIFLVIFSLLAGCASPSPTLTSGPIETIAPAPATDNVSVIATPIPTRTPNPRLTAQLSEVTGAVEFKPTASAEFGVAENGATLLVSGQVRTGADGKARINLSSGTMIRVAPSTIFTLAENKPAENTDLLTKLILEAGRVFIILNGGEMDVVSPSGQASVRGSYMSVWIDPETNNMLITCLEGQCSAGNRKNRVQFGAGQAVYVFNPGFTNDEETPPVLGVMSQEEFDAWLENNPEAEIVLEEAQEGYEQFKDTCPEIGEMEFEEYYPDPEQEWQDWFEDTYEMPDWYWDWMNEWWEEPELEDDWQWYDEIPTEDQSETDQPEGTETKPIGIETEIATIVDEPGGTLTPEGKPTDDTVGTDVPVETETLVPDMPPDT